MVHIGQLLSEERKRLGLTTQDVAKATKIREAFIIAIEKGDYIALPSSAYALGFVRNYIKFLGLPEEKTLALFRREFNAEKMMKVLPRGFTDEEAFPKHRVKLTQGMALILLTFLVLLGYLLFQYRYAVIGPPLEINSPGEMSTVSSQSVTVTGKTDPTATVTVNGSEVAVDDNGNFRKTVTLFSGSNTITIKVVNRFGKERTLVRHVTAKTS